MQSPLYSRPVARCGWFGHPTHHLPALCSMSDIHLPTKNLPIAYHPRFFLEIR